MFLMKNIKFVSHFFLNQCDGNCTFFGSRIIHTCHKIDLKIRVMMCYYLIEDKIFAASCKAERQKEMESMQNY